MYLNYLPLIQQILSDLVVSVVYWYFWSWVRILLPIITKFFSFKLKRLALS